jgi:hypothetical protein
MGTLDGEFEGSYGLLGVSVGTTIGTDDGMEQGSTLGALAGAIRPAGVVADGTTLGPFAGAGSLVSSLGTADSMAEYLTGTDSTTRGPSLARVDWESTSKWLATT